ncbi:MAG: SDR family oxidoreductase [Alphaproteobacteria bacterium]|nr:SDR family oxidoreductase [Alphaproteobacteria bacterium]
MRLNTSKMTVRASSLFCFGLGYSARVLAAGLQHEGFVVAGTSRIPVDDPHMKAFGPQHAFEDAWLDGVTHLLISIPPDSDGDPVLQAAGESLTRRARQFDWVGYLSTTGVYGDHGGGVVDETTPVQPGPGRSTWRAQAEAGWQALHITHGLPLHIFRLAGIYGPGRNALVNALAGTARRIDAPGQLFSRIHVQDIATVLHASIAKPNPGAFYNVCDDEPASGADVTAFACNLAGVPPPPLVALADADLSPMARSFYRDNRRVRNDRIKSELGVRLAYPTYREGLTALWAEMRN